MSDLHELLNVSGREDMSLTERADTLEADLMYPPFFGIGEATPASSQTIHDLKVTIGVVRSVFVLYRERREAGVPDEKLSKCAPSFFGIAECLVLAWRRGGHAEYQRVRREQLERCR